MDRKVIRSVGIDIGTTTTQVIFSLLTVVNRAPVSQVPAYEFIDREIIYQSPITFTPINYEGIINDQQLHQLIYKEIERAGLQAKDIDTGAIIITGETAKAQNAKASLMNLSHTLGDFVVATAGPHLESIIAGRGSGAALISEQTHTKVMNIDIGGGTSNYVIFQGGKVIDSACLNIGGRLLELNDDGSVAFVHHAGNLVIKDLFGEHLNPRQLTQDHLLRICNRMAEALVEVITGQISTLSAHLLMTEALKHIENIDSIFLSGGVGECYYHQQSELIADTQFNDIGPMLARALLKNTTLSQYKVLKPVQTLRATVIGAGAHSLALSGSTIWLNDDELPLKNIPVVHPMIDWQDGQMDICQQITDAAERMDLNLITDRFAIAIDDTMPLTYASVLRVTKALASFYKRHSNPKFTALIIMHQDIGKAIGMELQPLMPEQKVTVIDEVFTREGDYIDIGQSYFGGDIVPLTVKSLAFSN